MIRRRRAGPEAQWQREAKIALSPINAEIAELQTRVTRAIALARRADNRAAFLAETETILDAANELAGRIERRRAELGPGVAGAAPFQNAGAALTRLTSHVTAARQSIAGPMAEGF
jgi:hypothetical protein